MSGNNESVTQNADIAFQLRAMGHQLGLLSRMYMDLKDDVKSIKKQNSGAGRRGNTVCKAVWDTRSDFEEFVNMGEDDYDGDMESESDKSYCEAMPPLKDSDGDELASPVAGSLVIRRTLQVQVKENETNRQRENIFCACCYAQSKPRNPSKDLLHVSMTRSKTKAFNALVLKVSTQVRIARTPLEYQEETPKRRNSVYFSLGIPKKKSSHLTPILYEDIQSIRIEVKEGFNARRVLYMEIRGQGAIPLTRTDENLTHTFSFCF
uniref:Photosystem I assembly protein Ycf4 n=1 Tax=Salix viminalis TaxID=40686 RepID=A0A6N2LMQ1_SALVM